MARRGTESLAFLEENRIAPPANAGEDYNTIRTQCDTALAETLCYVAFPGCEPAVGQTGLACLSLRDFIFQICQVPSMVIYDEDVLSVVLPLEAFSPCGCLPNGRVCNTPAPTTAAPTAPAPTATAAPACVHGVPTASLGGSRLSTPCACEPGWVGAQCQCRECTWADIVLEEPRTCARNGRRTITPRWRNGLYVVGLSVDPAVPPFAGDPAELFPGGEVCCDRFGLASLAFSEPCGTARPADLAVVRWHQRFTLSAVTYAWPGGARLLAAGGAPGRARVVRGGPG